MKELIRRIILILSIVIIVISVIGCQNSLSSENETGKPPKELGINSSENMTDVENKEFNRKITERIMSYLENKYDEEFELKGRISTSSRYDRTYKVYAPETDYEFEPAIHGDKDTPIEDWYIYERYFSPLLRLSVLGLIREEIENIFGEMVFADCGIAMTEEFENEFLRKSQVEKNYLDVLYMIENEPENVSHLGIRLLLFRDFDKQKKEEFYIQLNQLIEGIRSLGFTELALEISFFDESIYKENNHFLVKAL